MSIGSRGRKALVARKYMIEKKREGGTASARKRRTGDFVVFEYGFRRFR